MPTKQRGEYRKQREQLALDVERYREALGLPTHEQAREITRERDRDQSRGREL
jgi:hypothetical protein